MRTFLMNNIRTPWYKSVTMATSSSYSEFSTRRISGVSSWTNRGGVLFFLASISFYFGLVLATNTFSLFLARETGVRYGKKNKQTKQNKREATRPGAGLVPRRKCGGKLRADPVSLCFGEMRNAHFAISLNNTRRLADATQKKRPALR